MSEMTPATRIVRLVLFVGLVAWMNFGPFYRQVLDGDNQHMREFRMYGTRARRTCQVHFEQKQKDAWKPVSRWEIEGYSFQKFPGRARRMLDKPKDALAAGRRLCGALGEDSELRYRMRCGHVRDGWGEWDVSEDLCAGGGR
ncbi:MAG: hypothetical protein KDA24_16810 [Deltaproteobacteria bacterium]|nr:hypothetical protein [Deltaproteobacteria bacterium]